MVLTSLRYPTLQSHGVAVDTAMRIAIHISGANIVNPRKAVQNMLQSGRVSGHNDPPCHSCGPLYEKIIGVCCMGKDLKEVLRKGHISS